MQVIGIRRVFFTCFVMQNKCFINQKPINLRLKTNKIKCYDSTLLGTLFNTHIFSGNFQRKFWIFFLDCKDFRRLLITQLLWEDKKDQSCLPKQEKKGWRFFYKTSRLFISHTNCGHYNLFNTVGGKKRHL